MSKEQVSIPELLLSLDGSGLQEADQVRAAVSQQLSTDRGGAVLCSLVEYYLDSSSSQAVLLLSSIREPHHKALLEKLNECVGRPGSRVAALTLLGHLVRKQPPWVHEVSRSPLLPTLLRCLKTDGDVVVLITGVLVLITLLPMIPQAGKQHIYDFFDVFGRLASLSYKNPGQVPAVQLVHLHAGVYSLFHRLYGMFPCNFVSYLRLHYSMKENLDTFQEVVKPMLQHVRVHPELVTGTQEYELEPSRWRCFEVHDIVIECSRVSLDPLESSCEEDAYSAGLSAPPQHLNLTCSPQSAEASGPVWPPLPGQLTLSPAHIQADGVTWSPSSHCGLSTPPPEPAAGGSAPPLSRTASMSGVKCPSSASVPVTPPTETSSQVKLQPIVVKEAEALSDVISSSADVKAEEAPPPPSFSPSPLTSTPSRQSWSTGSTRYLTPSPPGSTLSGCSPAPSYEQLFELAVPRAATLFMAAKAKEALEQERGGGGRGAKEGEEREEEHATVSPLKVLDQLIVHGGDAHQRLSRRSSAGSKSGDRSLSGGKQQSMRSKGSAHQGEELQSLRSQLLLVHGQLQYERFKRQQHAIRNRRLLRRIINATALEEQSVAMRAQLSVQDEEVRSLTVSLQEEQRRLRLLQLDSQTQSDMLHTHTQLLQLQLQEEQREGQRLQSELQECQSRLRDLEAELQKVNNKANNAEHQLTQLSLKLSSSEQLQHQIFLLNQQLVLLRETNRGLVEQLDRGETTSWTEASMLQCSVGKEYQRLKDSDVQLRQKLEAANHRTAELEGQLTRKEALIQEQKKLLEDTKTQSRCELVASDGRCVALRLLYRSLQAELLQLYSLIHQDTHTGGDTHTHTHSRPRSVSRANGGGVTSPVTQSGSEPRPFSSSAVGVINGAVEALSSPLHLPSCSSSSPLSHSPIESPLAVGSFLEQHARQLFGLTNQSQEEAEPRQEEEEEEDEGEKEEEEEEEEAQPESPHLGQEVEEATTLLTGSPPTEPPRRAAPPPAPPPPTAAANLTLAVRQRRHELSIMDYDEMIPEY